MEAISLDGFFSWALCCMDAFCQLYELSYMADELI